MQLYFFLYLSFKHQMSYLEEHFVTSKQKTIYLPALIHYKMKQNYEGLQRLTF